MIEIDYDKFLFEGKYHISFSLGHNFFGYVISLNSFKFFLFFIDVFHFHQSYLLNIFI